MTQVDVLRGPPVMLPAPNLDDAEPLFERIASDPEVPRYMSWRPQPNIIDFGYYLGRQSRRTA